MKSAPRCSIKFINNSETLHELCVFGWAAQARSSPALIFLHSYLHFYCDCETRNPRERAARDFLSNEFIDV